MTIEFYGIPELNSENVRFYSVKLGTNKISEYRNFLSRMMGKEENKIDLAELQHFIFDKISSNQPGAEPRFFKKEGFADRIKQPTPDSFDEYKKDPQDYGLRLFCLRLSDKVVILFNGDRKTYREVKDCKNCEPHFELANKICKSIDEAKYNGQIVVIGFDIIYTDDNFVLEIPD